MALGTVALCLFVLGLLVLPGRQEQAYGWVVHTLEVLGAANKLEADLEAAVSDGRAYVIDRSADSKRRFEGNASEAEADLGRLERLTANNAAQQGVTERLRPVIAARLGLMREIVRRFESGDEAGAMRAARTQQGRALMDRAVATLAELSAVERILLDQRGRAANGATQLTFIGLIACSVALAAGMTFTLSVLARRRREERHAAELEWFNALLADREAHFRALADNIPQLAWMADADGSVLWYNRRWHEYCGTTSEQMQGWGWQAVHDPEVLPDVLARWRTSIVTGEPFEMTFPLRGADGVFRPFLTRVRPVRDEQGRIHLWSGTNTEVTELRAAEAANAHLAAIVASTEDAIVSYAPECGRVLTWNKGAEQLFGYAAAEMMGRSAARLRPPDLPEDERGGLFAHVMAGRPVVAHETVRVSKSGERIPVSITAACMLAPDGRAIGVSAIFHDLRPRVRAEARLRESEAHLRGIVESSADSIKLLDLEGKLLSINGPGRRAMEIDDIGRFRSQPWTMLWPEAAHPDVERALATARGVGVGRFTTARPTVRGTPKWWDVVVSPVPGPNDRPVRLVAISRDVTEAHRAEVRLRKSEEALREAQKLEAIGRLAAGVAHDFNNILQGVSGGLELVLDEVEAGTTAREMAELALNSARRGSELTHYLLSYARKQMLQPKRVEVAPFLSEMQRLLARTLGPHIAVEVQPEMMVPSIEVDPGQLHTALLNLALNAAQAMPMGGKLSLNAREIIEADERWVVVAATDTGVGMDEATLAQACEPFFTTKGLDGTGLGLSMVQGFAEQSGGHVRIASAPGQGTTVMLWLPAVPMAAECTRERQLASTVLRGSGRVLLVDDAADVLATAGAFLERAGFTVVRASGGEQALAALASGGERFDALVTDYAMPGLNGLELIEQARALRPGLSALLITGFAAAGSGTGPLPEGVAVLRKPFQRRQLVEAVLGAMGHDAPAQEIGTHHGRAVQQQR